MESPSRRVNRLPIGTRTRQPRWGPQSPAGRTPGRLAKGARLRLRRKSRQNPRSKEKRPNHPKKRFVFVRISFRNGGTDLRCLETRVPIGLKPSANSFRKPAAASGSGLALPESFRESAQRADPILRDRFNSGNAFLDFFQQPIYRKRLGDQPDDSRFL